LVVLGLFLTMKRALGNSQSFEAILRSTRVVSQMIAPTNDVHTIATHDGSFHCDEALAIGLLKCIPAYKDSPVIRTRNPDILEQCNIVLDVGAKYEPANHRYDHHQREFAEVLEGYNMKLSSAGLIYKHFGKEAISAILKESGFENSPALVDIFYAKLYTGFMEHIDAIDNGVAIADTPNKYHISTDLSSRVGRLNPGWNDDQSSDATNAQFVEAMCLTQGEFVAATVGLATSWWPARTIVESAIKARTEVHASGKIMVLDRQCPWKDHFFELEPEGAGVLYCLYGDGGGSWRIQAVPVEPNSFTSRKGLPAAWRGIRNEALDALTGIPGGIFIHASGFIGGHKTKEGALAMATKALELD